eukprot:SAG22_NODE_1422_length_4464_cov_3.424742_1_plen_42_part_10
MPFNSSKSLQLANSNAYNSQNTVLMLSTSIGNMYWIRWYRYQ